MNQEAKLKNYILHIVEAIDRIFAYIHNMEKEAFANNRLVQDAVIRNMEIIGEASHSIEKKYPEFSTAHPEIPLNYAYQMRNALAHGYDSVDIGVVWQTIITDLPKLKSLIEKSSLQ